MRSLHRYRQFTGEVSRPRTFAPHAFTLIELLVSSAILTILMMILLGTLSGMLNLWRTTDNKITADREGRAAHLLLSQDLVNVVMPESSNLWPRLVTNTDVVYLQFLTLKPWDYQTQAGDVGDVCFVEYAFDPTERRLVRRFLGSKDTYDEILKNDRFPTPTLSGAQLVAENVLDDNESAAQRMSFPEAVPKDRFRLLDENLEPISAGERPRVLEYTFAAVDPLTATNEILLGNSGAPLKSAGLFTSRFYLP